MERNARISIKKGGKEGGNGTDGTDRKDINKGRRKRGNGLDGTERNGMISIKEGRKGGRKEGYQ